VLEKPAIRLLDTLAQCDPRLPAQRFQSGHVQQLARRAVGLGAVVNDLALVTRDLLHQRGELGDRDDLADTHIYEVLPVVVAHEEQACVGQIAHVQEFTPRRTRAPDGDRGRTTLLGLVELPYQSGQHWHTLEVESIA
jgi:hypothetical protein